MKKIKAAAVLLGAVTLVLLLTVTLNGIASPAPQQHDGTIKWIDVGSTQTSVVYPVPEKDCMSAQVLLYGERSLDVRRYDIRSGALGASSRVLIPSTCRPMELHTATDSRGHIWVATSDSLVDLDPATGATADVKLPRSAKPLPANDSSQLSDSQRSVWREEPVVGLAVDASDNVWISRDFTGTLIALEPKSKTFRQVDVPDAMESAGPIAFSSATKTLKVGSGSTFSTSPREAEVRELDPRTSAWSGSSSLPGAPTQRGVALNVDKGAVASIAANSANSLIAVGDNGDTWFLNADSQLEMVNAQTHEDKVYVLPRVKSRRRDVRPLFTSAIIDSNGNLWFSYAAFFQKAGTAIR